VSLVKTDVSEERIASIIRLVRIGELRTSISLQCASVASHCFTANVIPSSLNLVTLKIEAIISSEMSVPTKATPCNILEEGIIHSHRHENLNSYTALTGWDQ
jgi:hypothetical protein